MKDAVRKTKKEEVRQGVVKSIQGMKTGSADEAESRDTKEMPSEIRRNQISLTA